MPGPPDAALTRAAAGVLAHGWPLEIVIAARASTRAATASLALREAIGAIVDDPRIASVPSSERAIVVGTQSAAIAETTQFAREIAEVGAPLVNPALFPLTVMNAPAGFAAIQHRCEGPNVTLSNGPGSCLDALVYGADLIVERRAAVVFAGGFETLPDAPTDAAAAAVICALMVAGHGASAGAPVCARLVATASFGRAVPSDDIIDLGSAPVAAALEAGRGVLESSDLARATVVAVDTAAAALVALSEAAVGRVTLLVARREDACTGTTLILGPARDQRAGPAGP